MYLLDALDAKPVYDRIDEVLRKHGAEEPKYEVAQLSPFRLSFENKPTQEAFQRSIEDGKLQPLLKELEAVCKHNHQVYNSLMS